jgi:hypothetical protein
MDELSPTAQNALSALREQVGSSEERERVRARLGQLGLTVGSAAAVTAVGATALASAATSSAAVATNVSSSLVAGGALSGLASSAAPGGGGAAAMAGVAAAGGTVASSAGSVVATSAASAVATSSAAVTSAATGAGALSLLGAKLAALPLALKTGLATTVLVSTLGVPLVIEQPKTPRATTTQAASSARPVRPPSAEVQGPAAVELDLREPARIAPTLDTPAYVEATPPHRAATPRMPTVRSVASREAAAPLTEPQVSALASESALLERALRSVRAGDGAGAERLLDEHQARHGEISLLSRERERIRHELSRIDR